MRFYTVCEEDEQKIFLKTKETQVTNNPEEEDSNSENSLPENERVEI